MLISMGDSEPTMNLPMLAACGAERLPKVCLASGHAEPINLCCSHHSYPRAGQSLQFAHRISNTNGVALPLDFRLTGVRPFLPPFASDCRCFRPPSKAYASMARKPISLWKP